jgi:hypothetical protein
MADGKSKAQHREHGEKRRKAEKTRKSEVTIASVQPTEPLEKIHTFRKSEMSPVFSAFLFVYSVLKIFLPHRT